MGFRSLEEARVYAKEYRIRVKSGLIVPVPAREKRRRATIICDQCKKEFYRPFANRLDRGSNQYCSRDCMAKAFIGRESPRKGEWIASRCDHCSAPLSRPEWYHKQNSRTFCDSKCFGAWKAANWTGESNPAWAGGQHHYYGPNWDRQSRRARVRDNKECQFCHAHTSSARRNLDVHHIKPFRYFGFANYKQANLLSNLVTLCEPCHHFLEGFSAAGTITDWPSLEAAALLTPEGRRRRGLVAVRPSCPVSP
jgi:5-methylcytosine-specific restriction endonuclease McrA